MCRKCQMEASTCCVNATAAGQVERELMRTPEGRRALTDLRAVTREYDQRGVDRSRARGSDGTLRRS